MNCDITIRDILSELTDEDCLVLSEFIKSRNADISSYILKLIKQDIEILKQNLKRYSNKNKVFFDPNQNGAKS